MSSDGLTIVVGIGGVLASVLCSALAFRWGARQADRQRSYLVQETNRQKDELAVKIQEVRNAFSTFVRGVEDGRRTIETPSSRPSLGSARVGPAFDGAVMDMATTELLVRANLGALLDERGEVRLQRLFDEVASALGSPSQAATVLALQRLRDEGLVEWDGSADLSEADFVRVRPPGEKHRQLAGAVAGVVAEA